MKNWILINDRKFEIICHQNSNSKFIRAFTTYSDLPYEIDPRNINNQLKIFERDFPNFKRCYFKITDNAPPWAYIEVYYKVITE